jgi:type III restriction enzyme
VRVQGSKRGRIFADFIFAAKAEGSEAEFDRVFVVETKSMHLRGNADPDYKRSVLSACTERAKRKEWAECVPAMRGTIMKFEVVDQEEWEKRLTAMIAS